ATVGPTAVRSSQAPRSLDDSRGSAVLVDHDATAVALVNLQAPRAVFESNKFGDEVIGGIRQDLDRGANLGDCSARVEYHDLVAHRKGFGNIVGHENDG